MALRPCLGCGKLVRDRARCIDCHQAMMRAVNQRQDAGRGNTTERGLGWKHREWAKQILIRDNYVCQYCGAPATSADHVLPRKTHPHLAFDLDNGKACCKTCQNQKGDQQN
jgi:5-methylcytosine-specific restriction endonuclease McrA